MKSPKQHVWKWRIALMILVAWISLDGVAIITTAQVRPPRRQRRVMVSPDDTQKKDEPAVDIGKILVEIAQRASRQSMNQMVDLAFVIDGSVAMKESAKMVERSLFDMTGIFAESGIDYRFALIWFQHVGGESEIVVKPLQEGLGTIENNFVNIAPRAKFKGDIAGYGLDAIMEGVLKLKFRLEAENHLVVVTNSNLRTAWGEGQKRNSEAQKILEWCKLDEIHINVMGIDEDIQRQLADSTGGKWYGIYKDQQKADYQRTVDRAPQIDKSSLNIDEICKHIAQHIAATVRQPADIVFVFDSSLSMKDEVDRVCTGLDTLVRILDNEGLDYRFGIIRFWTMADGSKSTVLTTKPPLSTKQVKNLFRGPKHGSEHLLDAIMEGVPKLQTPDDRKLILIVVTDEPSSFTRGTKYTYTGAIEFCRDAAIQVNTIGGLVKVGRFADDFQRDLTMGTNGIHYIMPGIEDVLPNSRYQ